VDRSVKHGVLHRNSAARTKSRLTRAVQKLAAGTKA
jgi:ribosomal protein S20